MSGASFASCAIRLSFVKTFAELGISFLFPSNGCMTRCPTSLHRVPRNGSPASTVLLRHSDFLSSVTTILFDLVSPLPTAGHCVRSCQTHNHCLKAWTVHRCPPFFTDGDDRISQVAGEPLSTCSALGPRWGNLHLAINNAGHCCLPLSQRRRPHIETFEAQSHSPSICCLRFAAHLTVAPRKTRYQLTG